MIHGFTYDGHVHTSLGQGSDPPAECLRAAQAAGLAAVAFTDYYEVEESQVPVRLEAYRRAAGERPVRVVAGAECAILDPLGRLTLAESAARPFALVLARLSSLTEGVARSTPVRLEALLENLRGALVSACRRPHVNVLALPFNLGRFSAALTPGQIPLSLLEELGGVMREQEVACELANSIWSWYPELPPEDFLEEYARLLMAFSREGVKFVVGSDAHAAGAVGNLQFVHRLAAAAGLEKTQFVDIARLPALN
ncbi:MAG TPA: PHP domain-containing protein [Armatimonadota bacterium]|jgi:histidinol phosphatase-like PHP family hydrolase